MIDAMHCVLRLVAACLLCQLGLAESATSDGLLSRADSEIQRRIAAAAASWQKDVEFATQRVALKELADRRDSDRDRVLVEQIAIFAATSQQFTEFNEILALAVLQQLDINPRVIIRTLSPHLDSKNERLRGFVRDWFKGHDKSRDNPFHDYSEYVEERFRLGQAAPRDFVVYLFERDPGQALLAFNRAAEWGNTTARLIEMRRQLRAARDQRGAVDDGFSLPPLPEGLVDKPLPRRAATLRSETLLAERVVRNTIWFKNRSEAHFADAAPGAKEQLGKLADSDEWWSRLYVAEIMRRNRELRLASVLDELLTDSNELVRTTASRVKPLPPRELQPVVDGDQDR